MRLDCAEPGFETAYIEVDTAKWLRPEVNIMSQGATTDKWFALLRRKVTAVRLPVLEGEPITLPAHLTPEALDRVDYVLWNWFVWAVTQAAKEVIDLGNAPWRRSSSTPETNGA